MVACTLLITTSSRMKKHFDCKPASCASLRVFDKDRFDNRSAMSAIQRLQYLRIARGQRISI
jgi:hypothetical protein